MCYAKPGPRCAAHTRADIAKYKAEVAAALTGSATFEEYQEARENLASAERDYARTPENIKRLRAEGHIEEADMLAAERAEAMAAYHAAQHEKKIKRDTRGFDEDGIHRNGTPYDDYGWDVNKVDRFGFDKQGNHVSTGLTDYSTHVLYSARSVSDDHKTFTKGDSVKGWYPSASADERRRARQESADFDSLVASGYIEKSGRRWALTDKGRAALAADERAVTIQTVMTRSASMSEEYLADVAQDTSYPVAVRAEANVARFMALYPHDDPDVFRSVEWEDEEGQPHFYHEDDLPGGRTVYSTEEPDW